MGAGRDRYTWARELGHRSVREREGLFCFVAAVVARCMGSADRYMTESDQSTQEISSERSDPDKLRLTKCAAGAGTARTSIAEVVQARTASSRRKSLWKSQSGD